MKYVVLGSSASVPTRRRHCSSARLSCDSENALVDCGPRTARQLHRFGQALERISLVWLSHLHGDHCWGLPTVIRRLERIGGEHTLRIYANHSTIDRVKTMLKALLKLKQLRSTTVKPHVAEHGIFHQTKWFTWRTFPLMHRVPTHGLIVQERQPRGRKIVYVSDTMMFDGLIEACDHADLIVCESTAQARYAKLVRSFKHMTATQAAQLARRSKARRLVLTHISHLARASAIEREAREIFPNTVVAEDFSVFTVHDRHPPAHA